MYNPIWNNKKLYGNNSIACLGASIVHSLTWQVLSSFHLEGKIGLFGWTKATSWTQTRVKTWKIVEIRVNFMMTKNLIKTNN